MSSKLLTTKLDAVNLIYYLGPISFFMLFPFVIFWDLPVIQSDWIYLDDSSALYALTFSGIAAFMLNWSSFLAIKNTSALTFNVAGNFKSIINIILSVLIFHNQIPILNIVGCGFALAGVAWYNYLCLYGPTSALTVSMSSGRLQSRV